MTSVGIVAVVGRVESCCQGTGGEGKGRERQGKGTVGGGGGSSGSRGPDKVVGGRDNTQPVIMPVSLTQIYCCATCCNPCSVSGQGARCLAVCVFIIFIISNIRFVSLCALYIVTWCVL